MADATAGGGYRQKAIGLSDDQLEADGTKVLDYRQAESAAREWIARHNRIAAGREPEPSVRGTIHDTVKDATADDMANDEAQSGKSSSQIRIDCLFQR